MNIINVTFILYSKYIKISILNGAYNRVYDSDGNLAHILRRCFRSTFPLLQPFLDFSLSCRISNEYSEIMWPSHDTHTHTVNPTEIFWKRKIERWTLFVNRKIYDKMFYKNARIFKSPHIRICGCVLFELWPCSVGNFDEIVRNILVPCRRFFCRVLHFNAWNDQIDELSSYSWPPTYSLDGLHSGKDRLTQWKTKKKRKNLHRFHWIHWSVWILTA